MPADPRDRRLTVMAVLGLALAVGAVGASLSGVQLRGATSDGESASIELVIAGSGGVIDLVAKPEKRSPSTNNDATHLTVEVRNPGSTTPLFSQTVTTDADGTYEGLNTGLADGTYDVTAKGYSHLRVKQASVAFSNGMTIDFTDGGNDPLLCGDVNSTDGDNKVNGIDLSLIVGGLLGTGSRLDLNQDGIVNGIDLTNAVANLNQTGAS